jgi:hypothetical protein
MRFVPLLLLAACPRSDDTGPDGPCDNAISAVTPADGSTNVYYRDPIRVRFDAAEADAAVTVEGPGGLVSATSAWEGDTLVVTPAGPLAPSTTYTVRIAYSCGEPSTSFTTGDVGASVDPRDLVGRTWVLDLLSGTVVEPASAGQFLQQYIETILLVTVTDADAISARLVGALATEGSDPMVQAPCTTTMPMPVMDFTGNPFLSYGPADTSLAVGPEWLSISDLGVAASFTPDGAALVGIHLQGTVDTRPFLPYLDLDCGDDGCDDHLICDLAEPFGASCVACELDGGEYCLRVVIEDLVAVEIDAPIEELHSVQSPAPPPGSSNYCARPECSAEASCD